MLYTCLMRDMENGDLHSRLLNISTGERHSECYIEHEHEKSCIEVPNFQH